MEQTFILKKKACDLNAADKLLVLVCVFLLATVTTTLAQAQASSAIRAVIDAQAAAWNRGDIDGFMNGYAQSSLTTFVSDDRVMRGWETVRARYKKKYPNAEQMGRLTFSDIEITPLCSDTAMVLGRWQLKRKGDHPRGRFTLLFRRRLEGWRIVQDHTSSTTP